MSSVFLLRGDKSRTGMPAIFIWSVGTEKGRVISPYTSDKSKNQFVSNKIPPGRSRVHPLPRFPTKLWHSSPLSEISALQEFHRFPSTSSPFLSPQNDPSGWRAGLCQPDLGVFPTAEWFYLADEKAGFPNEIFATSAPQQSRNINKF